MLLDEIFHFVYRVTILLGLEVRVLGQEPGLGHGGVSGELIDLQDELQMLPPLLPSKYLEMKISFKEVSIEVHL